MLLATAFDNIGNKVIYKAGTPQQEEGVITEVRVAVDYIMVRYGSDVGSKATRPEDLQLLRSNNG